MYQLGWRGYIGHRKRSCLLTQGREVLNSHDAHEGEDRVLY